MMRPQGAATYDPLESIRQALDAGEGGSSYVTKDSGQREAFPTGARRDTQDGKPRFDLIPVEALRRLADLYARGARKYSPDNWRRGMPFSRVYASLLRHLYAWAGGADDGEDHLAAVAWNAFALMAYQEWVGQGRLPPTLDDMPATVPTRASPGVEVEVREDDGDPA